MLVDSSVAWTPVPAVAVPVSAGQLVAQSPLQTDWSPLSLVKAYRVRPSPSTRMSPSLPPATATVVPPVAWAAVVAGAAVAAVPDDSLLLPPQAAAATVSAARRAALASAFLMTGSPGRSRSDWVARSAGPRGQPAVPADGSPSREVPTAGGLPQEPVCVGLQAHPGRLGDAGCGERTTTPAGLRLLRGGPQGGHPRRR